MEWYTIIACPVCKKITSAGTKSNPELKIQEEQNIGKFLKKHVSCCDDSEKNIITAFYHDEYSALGEDYTYEEEILN